MSTPPPTADRAPLRAIHAGHVVALVLLYAVAYPVFTRRADRRWHRLPEPAAWAGAVSRA